MKILKRSLFIIGSILLSIAIALLLFAYFYNDKICSYIIDQLNQNLNAKVKIEKVSFSLIKKFPNASLNFQNVKINSSNEFVAKNKSLQNDPLLEAQFVSLEFNLFDLLTKEIHLNEIVVENGILRLYEDYQSQFNYDVFKTTTSNNTSFKTNIKKIKIIKTNALFENLKEHLLIKSTLDQLILSLSQENNTYRTKIKNNISSFTLIYQRDTITNKAQLKFTANVDYMNKLWRINCPHINLNGLEGNFSGQYFQDRNFFDFRYDIRDQKIEQLISFINLKYNLQGNITSSGTLKWRPDFKYPLLESDILIEDMSGEFQKFRCNNIKGNFNLSFKSEKTLKKASLLIRNLDIKDDSIKIKAEGSVTNFENPLISISLNSKGKAKKLNNLIENVSFNSGNYDLTVKIEGLFEYLKNRRLNSFDLSGFLKCNDISVTYKTTSLKDLTGKLNFKNTEISTDDLSFKYLGNDINYSGRIFNIPDYLENGEVLKIRGNVSSPSLKLVPLDSDTSQFSFPKNINIEVGLNLDEFSFKQHYFKNIKSNFSINNSIIAFKNSEIKCFNGIGKINSVEVKEISDGFSVTSDGTLENINIKELFSQYKDFDQTFISYKNLSGSLSGTYSLSAETDKDFYFDKTKFTLSSNVVIEKGNLVDLKPLESLSKFIDINELKNVKFSTLKNTINIRNGVVVIPQMDVFSSACNLNLFGKHSFNNEYEYHIQVVLSELLSKKHKQKSQEEEYNVIEDEDSKKKLFLKITGKDNDFKVSYDKAEAFLKMKEKFKKEKETFKSLVKGENSLEEQRDKRKNIRVSFTDDSIPSSNVKQKNSNKKKVKLDWKDE